MANKEKTTINAASRKYVRGGIIAVVVIAIAAVCAWGLTRRGGATTEQAMAEITTDAATAGDLRIAVIRMDAIQNDAKVLQDLRKQRESVEEKLRDELTREQKALEKEKAEIEKSQDVLSRDALQRRVVDYQNRVTKLQRDLAERAQAIEVAYQKTLNEIQAKHLDPIIEGTIAKKNLSLVIDGRFARMGANAQNLDITDEVIKALNKKVSTVKMEKPAK